ncbi:MAG TPA: BON domain-containing protein [Vicinamibacterales bacterium]|nr:BON domain-containing protein [Vicinamibacterales bacterium]
MRTGVLLVGWLLTVPSMPSAVEAQAHDARLADRAIESVRSYVHFSIFDDVTVTVDRAVVRLDGRVTRPDKRTGLEARVGALAGVREVVNAIKVLPRLESDTALRQSIANAIYGHPAFWHYAAMARPPIHIVVERGDVRLAGVVASHVERQLAFALAQVTGAASLRNDLRVE